jgi:hypothetical protein
MSLKIETLSQRHYLVFVAGVLLALGGAYYVSSRPMDFRVYYYGARGVADGTRPMYGPSSGMGWPMHYRYPPLFLTLFAPLARLPLAWGSAIWLVLKCLVLAMLLPAMWRRFGPIHSNPAWIIPVLLAGPYVVEELRYGNAQLFVFALTAAALLNEGSRPKWAAAALGLAISIKVWPLFFVPYLAVRRKSAVAAGALVFAAAFTLLPSIFIGFDRNTTLLREWAQQETAIQTGESEIWFPSQSLRGVMMRYLTFVDYSRVPDHNYPLVHWAKMDPHTVLIGWRIAVVSVYIAFLAFCRWRSDEEDWKHDALAFCLLALLEPFTPKYALVVLLWPAIALGRLAANRQVRTLALCPACLILVQPIAPGAAAQRLMQVLGVDFLATLALLIIIGLACISVFTDSQTDLPRTMKTSRG